MRVGRGIVRGAEGMAGNGGVTTVKRANGAGVEFVDGVTVVDRSTVRTLTGTVDLRPTQAAIEAGPPYPFNRDGITFQNRSADLPLQTEGYYREFTVPTPGALDRGPQRIIVGNNGEMYYTPDHYSTFIPLN